MDKIQKRQGNYKVYAKLRDLSHMTDYGVATKLGISRTTLYAWQRGEYEPKYETKVRIAQLIGVPVTSLLEGNYDSEESN